VSCRGEASKYRTSNSLVDYANAKAIGRIDINSENVYVGASGRVSPTGGPPPLSPGVGLGVTLSSEEGAGAGGSGAPDEGGGGSAPASVWDAGGAPGGEAAPGEVSGGGGGLPDGEAASMVEGGDEP
jgi:hypothetical protein